MEHLCLNEKLAEFDFNKLQIFFKSTLCVSFYCDNFSIFGFIVFWFGLMMESYVNSSA